jgi:hypothetical protein
MKETTKESNRWKEEYYISREDGLKDTSCVSVTYTNQSLGQQASEYVNDL